MPKRVLFLVAAVACLACVAQASEPLHVQIDRQIAAKAGGPLNPVADDATFLRRVYLDLAGRIPSVSEARAFLDDAAADKRARLVDRLLAGPDYPRRMQELFEVMLMERLGEHPEWSTYLRKAFTENRPWDQMVREILKPNDEDEATRASAFFYSKRLENYGQNPVDYPGLVRDVGRLFLGMDVQCAQCHDHLHIDDYKQVHFQGLYAFFGHLTPRGNLPYPAINEKPVTQKVEFMSVFIKEKEETGPRIPGLEEVSIPEIKKGEEYEEVEEGKKRLKFSPLVPLAEQLPSPANPAFARNLANRLWWMMMGRGLVEPLDLHHSDNPPSHPELLDLLAAQAVEHNFDIKWLLRQLVLSETYARTSLLPEENAQVPPESYRVALERPLSAEQMLWSVLQATGELDLLPPEQESEPPVAEAEEGKESQGAASKESKLSPREEKLKELRAKFVAAIANPPREPEVEYNPSLRKSLFLLNDSTVQNWLEPKSGNLVDRLQQMSDAAALVDELYLAVLTRKPDDEEKAAAVEYLSAGEEADRMKRISHLAWALVASAEFCINH